MLLTSYAKKLANKDVRLIRQLEIKKRPLLGGFFIFSYIKKPARLDDYFFHALGLDSLCESLEFY